MATFSFGIFHRLSERMARKYARNAARNGWHYCPVTNNLTGDVVCVYRAANTTRGYRWTKR